MTMEAAAADRASPAPGPAGRPEIVLKSSEFRKGREAGWRELENLVGRVEKRIAREQHL